MATTPFAAGTYSSFVENAINATGGTTDARPLFNNTLTPAAQTYASTALTKSETQAIQLKTQGRYSNKQFIAPMKYDINVEGTWVTVDCLGKRVITNNNVAYRSLASLSAAVVEVKNINDSFIRTVYEALVGGTGEIPVGTPTQNAASQIFNTGTSAITQALGSRYTQYASLFADNATSQTPNNAIQATLNTGFGILNQILPTTQINQSLAKIPGLNIVTNTLGTLPGGSNLTNILTNPVGAAEGLVGSAAKNLNLTLGLPSLNASGGSFDLGSIPSTLSSVFGIATDVYHNGPPTSLTGVISLEKQIKGIVCNFKLPNIELPSLDSITSFKFPKLEDIAKQIKKEFEDLKSNIINQLDIVNQLKELIPNPEDLYESVIKELTTCENNPNSEANSKGGQSTPSSK